jgi:hypothetical protein
VGDNWDRKVPSAYQVKNPKQTPTYHILDLSNRALVVMTKAEKNAGQRQTECPSRSGASEELGYTIHQVTAVNQLFSESGKAPRKQQRYRQHCRISDKWTKVRKVRPLMEVANQ